MSYVGTTDAVLWMAEYYSLAKCFPDEDAWMSLLARDEDTKLTTFRGWLWKEIWRAAQTGPQLQGLFLR